MNHRTIDKDWSLRWVRERVIPPDRQNIGQILRENHMEFYDEFPLLVSNQGRSCQDECYLVQIEKETGAEGYLKVQHPMEYIAINS